MPCTHSIPLSLFELSRSDGLVEIATSFANIEDVLSIPPVDSAVLANERPNQVKHVETSFLKNASPISRPLLIDAMGSPCSGTAAENKMTVASSVKAPTSSRPDPGSECYATSRHTARSY
jgi:hypothetical protein